MTKKLLPKSSTINSIYTALALTSAVVGFGEMVYRYYAAVKAKRNKNKKFGFHVSP